MSTRENIPLIATTPSPLARKELKVMLNTKLNRHGKFLKFLLVLHAHIWKQLNFLLVLQHDMVSRQVDFSSPVKQTVDKFNFSFSAVGMSY